MFNVNYAECHIQPLYAECRYAECRYAERLYAECRYAECRYAERLYAECRYAECRYAERLYAECRYAVCVIMLTVMAPFKHQPIYRDFFHMKFISVHVDRAAPYKLYLELRKTRCSIGHKSICPKSIFILQA
jgi:hypothetical protein